MSRLKYLSRVVVARLLFAVGDHLPELKENAIDSLADGEPWLELRPSLIRGAGNGLFIAKALDAGTRIGVYTGTRKTLLELLRTRDRTTST